MPTGPSGEKRPADVIANAVHMMRVATGEAEETYVNEPKSKGGRARAEALTPERRAEIAKKAAATRWKTSD